MFLARVCRDRGALGPVGHPHRPRVLKGVAGDPANSRNNPAYSFRASFALGRNSLFPHFRSGSRGRVPRVAVHRSILEGRRKAYLAGKLYSA